MMSEGRKTKIVLLDDRQLEILVQPKLLASELFDIVASHFNLKEKEYFGLMFTDETGHGHWLQWDRRVLEHDFPRRTGPIVLFFAVRFFIESISYLQDNATVELFYLQARQLLNKGALECDSDTVFELAALVLQAVHSDYVDTPTAREHLKKLSVLPTHVLKEYPCLSYCEDQVVNRYHKLIGCTRGICVVNYMSLVESLPTYGIHYYEVKDKSGIPWWLGISYKGISLYDHNDRKTPRRVFAWKQLENLYFRDRKFSIEVHDPKRVVHTLSNFNLYDDAVQESVDDFDELSDAISDPTTLVSVSRRTFGPSAVNVHAWLTATPQLTKCIWTMAVAQHQFYLDRKQSELQYQPSRSLRDIAVDLSRSTSSLHSSVPSDGGGSGSGSLLNRSGSARSLNALSSSRTELRQDSVFDDSDLSKAAQRDLWAALKARKECVEMELKSRLETLKELCIKEAEMTGELPPEIPLEPGEPRPDICRRVGTTFTLSPKVTDDDQYRIDMAGDRLSKLELEFELQEKITAAYHKLTKEASVAKNIRKNRQQCYRKAYNKLKDIEKTLNEYHVRIGKAPILIHSFYEDPAAFVSPVNSPAAVRRRANSQCSTHRDRVLVVSSTSNSSKPAVLHCPMVSSVNLRHLQRNISAPSSPIRLTESHTLPSRADTDWYIDYNYPLNCLPGDFSNPGHASPGHHSLGHHSPGQQCSSGHHRPGHLSPGTLGHWNHGHQRHDNQRLTSHHPTATDSTVIDYQYNSTKSSPVTSTAEGFLQKLVDRAQRRTDVNLYHVASNPTAAYVSNESLATSRVGPTSAERWPSKHGSLDSGRWQLSDSLDRNLSSSCLLQLNSPNSDAAERVYTALPHSLTSPPVYYQTPPHLRAAVNPSADNVEHYLTPPSSHLHTTGYSAELSTIVSRSQNCVEVSKPFEMSDVYKYSTKLRRCDQTGSSNSTSNGTVGMDQQSSFSDICTSDLRSVSSQQLSGRQTARPPNYDTLIETEHRLL